MAFKKHHTEESKKKMSKAKLGEKNSFYGKHLTKEAKQKISEANSGRIVTEKTRKKMRLSHMGQPPWNKGKHLTKETKDKISESMLGEKNHLYGKHLTKETREKMSKAKLDADFLNTHGTTRTLYPYNMVFDEKFKDMIRERDGNECVITGMTNEEHKAKYGRSLHVHHWTYDKDETNPFYFVTVTCGINIAAETNRGDWIDLFNGIMEDKYNETCNNGNGVNSIFTPIKSCIS